MLPPQTMPVMAVSMALSTTPEDFYKIKDAFLSNMATLLGIDVSPCWFSGCFARMLAMNVFKIRQYRE